MSNAKAYGWSMAAWRELADALCDLARARGADFRFGDARRASSSRAASVAGVETEEGERISSEAVIWNGDVAALADGSARAGSRARGRPRHAPGRSLSALTWAMAARGRGVSARPPQRFLLARLPGGIRRPLRAPPPAARPDRLCLRAGSRTTPAARRTVRRRARLLPRQRPRATGGPPPYRSGDRNHASKRLSDCWSDAA